ncbi:MFS transporter [Brevibacillus sp. MCWH]|jgi:MFS family permease|nr:MFS transporter [Brevibacillus sp. MCWH]
MLVSENSPYRGSDFVLNGLPLSRFTGMLATNSSLRNLWLARAVSALGDYVYSVALMWFVYEQTHSALQTGLLFILKFLPEPFVGLYFGVLADRLNRRRLMQFSDLFQMLAMLLLGVLIASGSFHMWHLYVITICASMAGTLFRIAQTSLIPDLVGRHELVSANALLSVTMQLMRMIGATLGGILVAIIGVAGTIEINALSFLVSLAFVQRIRHDKAQPAASSASAKSVNSEIKEGLNWLVNNKIVLLLMLLGTLANVALAPTNVLPPMLIQREFHGDARMLGWFETSIALGLLLGGILVGTLSPKKVGRWFLAGLGLEAVGMLSVAVAPFAWMAYAGNFLLGIGVMVCNIPLSTLMQTLIPDRMRGRVNSMTSIAFNISIPITYGGIGALADVIGAKPSYGLGALLLALCAAIGGMNAGLRSFDLGEGQKAGEANEDAGQAV